MLSPNCWRNHTPKDVQRARNLSGCCLRPEGLPPALSQAQGFLKLPKDHIGSSTHQACGAGHLRTGLVWSHLGVEWAPPCASSPRAWDNERWVPGCHPASSGWKAQGTGPIPTCLGFSFRITESWGISSILPPCKQTWQNYP